MPLSDYFRGDKNNKFLYYLKNNLRWALIPNAFYRRQLATTLAELLNRPDRDYIEQRVAYYNKLNEPTPLPQDAPPLAEHRYRLKNISTYFFDTFEYTRWFPPTLRWLHLPGDVIHVPDHPTIVKSRPVIPPATDNNANSVLLNLNKLRHFIFINDPTPFDVKQPKAIFRGAVYRALRKRFFERIFGQPLCDIAATGAKPDAPREWLGKKLSIRDHLNYQFIFALEGNDVASNLKWVMSSNSAAVMPAPTYETWFMEARLLPNVHYIEVKSDFSDVEDRLRYYIAHPEEAKAIIHNAHDHVAQFQNPKRERLISLLVLQKYFHMTGQL
ncbi:MAG: glycosyltransferase family 90 protein [Phycisphaerales bacterium]|nr:glycosyltransferase family 90 protein [Phycisphaerales bacterium]